MFAPKASFVLILALLSGQALSSAVKGHNSAQTQQRAVEQASIKSPAAQQQLSQAPLVERQPKAAAPAQPILESSKKVYNDESIRRSAASQHQVVAEPAAKSIAPVAAAAAPVPVVAPVVPAASAPVVSVVSKEPIVEPKKVIEHQPAAIESKSAPVLEQAKPVVEPVAAPAKPVAGKVEELPAQSARSAPIKEEPIPVVSKVIVEQVVPAKIVEQAPVGAIAAAAVEPVPAKQPVVMVVEQPAQPVIQSAPAVVAPVPVVPVVVAAEPVAPMMIAPDSPLQAKKDEQPAKEAEPAPIEVPAPDPGLVLSEPIDSTTKLLIDLDEHVQKFLPAEDKQEPMVPAKDQTLVSGVDFSPIAHQAQPSGKSSAPLVPYSSESDPIVPPLPQSIDKVEKASGVVASPQSPASGQTQANTRQASGSHSHQHQGQNQQQMITQLLDQLDSLQNRIQDTMNQLVARRRYVMSALLRPMGTYVRRVRTNLERLQNRVNQLQAAAVSVGGNQNGQRPGGFVDHAAIETIRHRIDDISKRISDIVNRIRFSLTPTSAPLNNNGK